MNARRRARAAALGCLAACALPAVTVVMTVVPAGAATENLPAAQTFVMSEVAAPLPVVEASVTRVRATEAEGEEKAGGEEGEAVEGSEKDNGLGIGIIAVSLLFGLLCAPFLKLASLKQAT